MNARLPIVAALEYAHPAMNDWLTLKLSLVHLPPATIRKLTSIADKLIKINPDGELIFESYCWESVRSDTHQVCVKIGGELLIQGSPARVGLPNNMFGSLDLRYCAQKMIHFAANHLGLGNLPSYEYWDCTRIDVTQNYLMMSESEASQALSYLKQSPEGRQKHSFDSYGFNIGKGSTLHSGLIYLKGQDARRNHKKGKALYTDIELLKAEKILRAEYRMRRHIIQRLKEEGTPWYHLAPENLLKMHAQYFREYFSEMEFVDMTDVLEKLLITTPTKGQAQSAYDCYTRIRLVGYEQAKESYARPTWYRHVKHLKSIGLTRADLNPSNVVPLRKRRIEVGMAVKHWDDIPLAS